MRQGMESMHRMTWRPCYAAGKHLERARRQVQHAVFRLQVLVHLRRAPCIKQKRQLVLGCFGHLQALA